MSLTFEEFQAANNRRNHTPHWQLSQWGNALAGETGEACNIIKKIERGDFKTPEALEAAHKALGKELGDIAAYCALTAQAAGLRWGTCTRDKFNEVSDRIGSEVKL